MTHIQTSCRWRPPSSPRELRVSLLLDLQQPCARPPLKSTEAACTARLLRSCGMFSEPGCFIDSINKSRLCLRVYDSVDWTAPCALSRRAAWPLFVLRQALPHLERYWSDLHISKEVEQMSDADVVRSAAQHSFA